MIEQAIPPKQVTRRLSAILFIDLVDSVRLVQQHAEETIARWRAFVSDVTQQDLPPRHGRVVKLTGDGLLIEFASAGASVESALVIQARLDRMNQPVPLGRRFQLRMGAHLADVLADEVDLYGDGVNLAARLMALAGPGETIISAAVRDQVTEGIGVTLEDLGERKLKGLERPVRAYRVWPQGPMPARSADRRRRVGDVPAIAVLPFRNLSGNPRHDFLGDLIAEDVIGDLSRLTDLNVISRLSTAPFRDRLYEPRSIAEMLGVRYVLAGSIISDDTRLRLTAELTEADAARVVWSDRFDGSLANIFELQDRVSAEIATGAIPHLRQLEFRRARAKRPEDLTAYELTLRAIDFMHGRSREDLLQAQGLLMQAITIDTQYAAPRVWLARSHILRVGQGWSDDPQRDAREALRHAEEAMERDGNDAYAIAVWGFVSAYLQKDMDLALARYDRALAINPSAVWAWAWSASAHAWKGEGAKAIPLIQRAIDLSPFDPHMYNFAAIASGAHAVAGDYDAAIEWGRRSLRENRLFTAAHKLLTISLALGGQMVLAREAASELMALEPRLTVNEFRSRHPGSGGAQIDRFCEALSSAGVPR